MAARFSWADFSRCRADSMPIPFLRRPLPRPAYPRRCRLNSRCDIDEGAGRGAVFETHDAEARCRMREAIAQEARSLIKLYPRDALYLSSAAPPPLPFFA